MRMRSLVAGVALALSTAALADPLTKEEKLEDFDLLTTTIHANYGPYQYKKDLGLDVDAVTAAYRDEVAATESNGEFYRAMARYVAEFKDSHFGLSLPTTHKSWLGFTTDLVEGKVVVDTVDRTVLSTAAFPFERGDEIVSIDGVATADLLRELARPINAGFDGGRMRRAAMIVSQRPGVRYEVPTGPATVEIRPWRDPSTVKTVGLTWIEAGEPLDEAAPSPKMAGRRPFAATTLSIKEIDDELMPFGVEQSYRCSGTTRIKIPADATMIMDKPFVAYYHVVDGVKVGYLRIPHYQTFSETQEIDELLALYEFAIDRLESTTDGLIIDQDHNCGGYVHVVEEIVSMFVDREVSPLTFRFLATMAEYKYFNDELAATPQNTLWYADFKPVVDLIHRTWRDGSDRLTPTTTFRGTRPLAPSKVRYKKPVVMLIDEMSGSGGDAFPAMMQGYGRAKLLGTRTVGAGGHVAAVPFTGHTAFDLRMTKSLFFRPDGVAVENNGAVPDYPYTPTHADFVGGYLGYQKFYLDKLLALVRDDG